LFLRLLLVSGIAGGSIESACWKDLNNAAFRRRVQHCEHTRADAPSRFDP
jgi:hypothetical protein